MDETTTGWWHKCTAAFDSFTKKNCTLCAQFMRKNYATLWMDNIVSLSKRLDLVIMLKYYGELKCGLKIELTN